MDKQQLSDYVEIINEKLKQFLDYFALGNFFLIIFIKNLVPEHQERERKIRELEQKVAEKHAQVNKIHKELQNLSDILHEKLYQVIKFLNIIQIFFREA